jgi:hypothetical protein
VKEHPLLHRGKLVEIFQILRPALFGFARQCHFV